MNYIVVAVDSEGKESFFGPFDCGDQAATWAESNFDDRYTVAALPLNDPRKKHETITHN